jgi:hypothetical protein
MTFKSFLSFFYAVYFFWGVYGYQRVRDEWNNLTLYAGCSKHGKYFIGLF